MIRRNRNWHGGGLLLYISDDIPSTCLRRHPSLELLVVELIFKQGPLTLALYYRPPFSVTSMWTCPAVVKCPSIRSPCCPPFTSLKLWTSLPGLPRTHLLLLTTSTWLLPLFSPPALPLHLRALLITGHYSSGLNVLKSLSLVELGTIHVLTGTPLVLPLMLFHLILTMLTLSGWAGSLISSEFYPVMYQLEYAKLRNPFLGCPLTSSNYFVNMTSPSLNTKLLDLLATCLDIEPSAISQSVL